MPSFHIAQLNIARAVAPLDSPVMVEFMAALDEINALADSAPALCGGSRATMVTPHPIDLSPIRISSSIFPFGSRSKA